MNLILIKLLNYAEKKQIDVACEKKTRFQSQARQELLPTRQAYSLQPRQKKKQKILNIE